MARQPRPKTRTTKSPKGAKPRKAAARPTAPAAKRPAKRATVRAARRTKAPHAERQRARHAAAALTAAAPESAYRAQAPVPAGTWQTPSSSPFLIPTGYGDHKIVLMVKDPWWLYAYWELQPDRERQVRRQLNPDEASGLRMVLRVHDVTGRTFPDEPASHWFDVTVSDLATNWFLHVNAPNRSFVVEIGLLTRARRFLMLARSNRVTTPRFGPSEVLDEAWMVSDEAYWKLFGITAGVGMGSSAGLKQALERQLSSPGMWSPLFGSTEAPKPAPNA